MGIISEKLNFDSIGFVNNDNFLYLRQLLLKLKNEYNLLGLKIDFASEFVSAEELSLYKRMTDICELNLTAKIGGCDAITDLFYAKNNLIKNILIPMVETPYALNKSIENIKKVYGDISDLGIFINIETITTIQNLKLILNDEDAVFVKGIVLGRDDLTKSMGLSLDKINSDEILKNVLEVAEIADIYKKEFIIGGKIFKNAFDFLRSIPKLTKIETRRVIFDSRIVSSDDYNEAISIALNFEKVWLENFATKNGINTERIKELNLMIS